MESDDWNDFLETCDTNDVEEYINAMCPALQARKSQSNEPHRFLVRSNFRYEAALTDVSIPLDQFQLDEGDLEGQLVFCQLRMRNTIIPGALNDAQRIRKNQIYTPKEGFPSRHLRLKNHFPSKKGLKKAIQDLVSVGAISIDQTRQDLETFIRYSGSRFDQNLAKLEPEWGPYTLFVEIDGKTFESTPFIITARGTSKKRKKLV
eukprot:TRINITY_DN22835_c0_g1_i1.p1 TRINITY_DN22835_c0_g1~~TRINITY_DN22835_c0_g1_i1.p1  ORF type:complete len:205 (-),score=41.39 TRINITY_DN22835_c0_g1_i1:42-656(-)